MSADLAVVLVTAVIVLAGIALILHRGMGWAGGETGRVGVVVTVVLALPVTAIAVVNRPLERVWDRALGADVNGSAPAPTTEAPDGTPPQTRNTPTAPASKAKPEETTSSQPAAASTTGSWKRTSNNVTLSVTAVEISDEERATLRLRVDNGLDSAVDLPLFGYFVVTDDTDQTYSADTTASRWSVSVPPGGFITGRVTLDAEVPRTAKTFTVSFATVFGALDGPRSITVRNVPVPR